MPLVSDITRRANIRRIAGALEVTRTFRVSGIIASPTEVLFSAINFPGIPEVGDAYPGGRDEYRVREVTARPDGGAGNDVLVFVVYSDKTGQTWNQETPDPGESGQDVKQISSSLATYQTSFDSQDPTPQPMTLNPPASAGINKQPYLSKANVQYPVGNIVFERTETVPPTNEVRNQVGLVNSVLVGPYPARTLLFTRLDAQSVDGGRVWRTIYEFAYNSRVWVHRDTWTRPDGKTPVDATEQTFFIYREFDYATLGLDFSDSQTPLP